MRLINAIKRQLYMYVHVYVMSANNLVQIYKEQLHALYVCVHTHTVYA